MNVSIVYERKINAKRVTYGHKTFKISTPHFTKYCYYTEKTYLQNMVFKYVLIIFLDEYWTLNN